MTTAVLALHYQNEVVHPEGRIRLGVAEGSATRQGVVEAAGRLLGLARSRGLPLVHVRIAFPVGHVGIVQNAPIFRNVVASGAMQEGSWGVEFHEGLGPLVGEAVVTHDRVNAFYGSALADKLAELGAQRLIIAGVATNSVVEHTARHAVDMGFEVAVAADACSAGIAHLHQAALDNIALLGEVGTVESLLREGV